MSDEQAGPRKPTIRTVAERAGVSLKTVSRVINNEPSVLPATRARVLQTIAELDYAGPVRAQPAQLQRLRDRAGLRQPEPVPHHRPADRRAGRLS